MKLLSAFSLTVVFCAVCVSSTSHRVRVAKNPCDDTDAHCWKLIAQKYQYRDDRKAKNIKICEEKWGGLGNLCHIIMSTEQSASYPLKCTKEHARDHDPKATGTCYYNNDDVQQPQTSFSSKWSFKGEHGRDLF